MFRLITGILFVAVATAWAVLVGLVVWVPKKKDEWSGLFTSPSDWQAKAISWSDWMVGGDGIPGYLMAGVPLALITLALIWFYLKLRARKKRKEKEQKD